MSHSSGRVYFKDGKVLWFEYNGTCDVIMPWLYKDDRELDAHWRRGDDFPSCSCGGPPEEVIVEWHYANGHYVPGHACRKCMVIIDPLDPWDTHYDDMKDGYYKPDEVRIRGNNEKQKSN